MKKSIYRDVSTAMNCTLRRTDAECVIPVSVRAEGEGGSDMKLMLILLIGIAFGLLIGFVLGNER